jgi:predicted RNA-binding protein with PIN domain
MAVVIDGYNVIHCADDLVKVFGGGDLERARARLCGFAAAAHPGEKVVVVFDATKAGGDYPTSARIAGVEVLFSAKGQTADELIVKHVRHLRPAEVVTVVTSDREVRQAVREHGVRVVGAREYVRAALGRDKVAPKRRRGPKQEGVSGEDADRWAAHMGLDPDRPVDLGGA